MRSKYAHAVLALIATVAVVLAGCSGSGSSNSSTSTSGSSNGTVSTMVSDAPENDWATVAVRVASISLNPQSGGSAVNIYTAPSTPPPFTNLVLLDQLGELFDNASVVPGTYVSATLTLSANPGDVMLTASEDPDTGFAGQAGATVPSSQIQIQGATGSAGSKTVSLTVNFVAPLVVSANQNNQMDLEFDLDHPALIVAHNPPAAAGQTIWAINFNGPVHHHPIAAIARFLLRDIYGTVTTVNSTGGLTDNSITISRDFPVEPPTSPEGEISSSIALTIQADASNDTLFYNLDASPVTPVAISSFTSVATLLTSGTEFVRVAARYQPDGTLVAVRVWTSSSFDKVWENPEGHVLHVNATTNILTVERENGTHINLQVVDGANPTQFYFRTPASGQSDTTIIGSGTAFLANIKRGFKVHVLANPLTSPETAVTVDIQTARFDGSISSSTTSGFDYTRIFATPTDSYTNFPLVYISDSTPNGNDPLTSTPILGFKWWNFTFPTKETSNVTDTSAAQTRADFVSATNGMSVNFGGALGTLPVYGDSYAVWNDPVKANVWAAPFTILLPSPVPLASVSTGLTPNSTGGTFQIIAPPGIGPMAVTVDVTSTSGSAALVYQVDRTAGIVTISPIDITTPSGLATFSAAIKAGTLVKIAGVPEATGHLKSYVIFYFTGDAATMPIS